MLVVSHYAAGPKLPPCLVHFPRHFIYTHISTLYSTINLIFINSFVRKFNKIIF